MNNISKKLKAAVTKKATGFTADEVVEEYGINPDGEFALLKRKATKKYYPPDTSAISKVQEQWAAEENLSNLSESQLLQEKSRLLAELKLGDEKKEKK